MERIDDISKLRLQSGSVLIKLTLKSGKIVAPSGNDSKSMVDHAEIIAVAEDVKDLFVGDIVLDFGSAQVFDWRKNKYAIIHSINIRIAVGKDNFYFGTKVDKKLMN